MFTVQTDCSQQFLRLCGISHGFEDSVVESFELFVGITDHKFQLEVFEEERAFWQVFFYS